jgi:hypothetical protein
VEEAQDAKAKTQAFIDRFSTWYTPAVMVLALVAGLISGDVVLALTLLVIGCPGALVISIPVAIVAGIGRAAQRHPHQGRRVPGDLRRRSPRSPWTRPAPSPRAACT